MMKKLTLMIKIWGQVNLPMSTNKLITKAELTLSPYDVVLIRSGYLYQNTILYMLEDI